MADETGASRTSDGPSRRCCRPGECTPTAGYESPDLSTRIISPPAVPGLRRQRIERILSEVPDRRLTTVVGPAGSGKTTLLGQLAERHRDAVVWYRAEARDWEADDVLEQLEHAFRIRICSQIQPEGWHSVEDAAGALRQAGPAPLYLLVDDLHRLSGSPALQTLGQLVRCLPPTVRMVVASRTAVPGLEPSDLRAGGELLEIDADDLRFRFWEAERLFKELYGEALLPDELTQLTRSTGGWAVGLKLFHLAVSGKSRQQRRHTLDALEKGSQQLTRDYLTGNVLEQLPADQRDFLLETCVLDSLTPDLCDRLRGSTGSEGVLAQLVRRQVFTARIDDRPTYRYHAVLRRYLRCQLADRLGPASTRRRFHEAGRLQEEAGFSTEALHAYCRAEMWSEARRLVRGSRQSLAADPGRWIEELPPAFVAEDPWLLLVSARRRVAIGDWSAAGQLYRRAERALDHPASVARCARERDALQAWLRVEPSPVTGWSGRLRRASRAEPTVVADDAPSPDGPAGCLARAALALLGGDVHATRRWLDELDRRPAAEPVLAPLAVMLAAVASWLAGDGLAQRTVLGAADTLEELDLPWLARFAHAVLALGNPAAIGDVARLRGERQACGDRWGAALAGLIEGLARLEHDRPGRGVLETTAGDFRELGAGTLEAWARGAGSLAAAGNPDGDVRSRAGTAIRCARETQTPGALLMALLAARSAEEDRGVSRGGLARNLAGRLGIDAKRLGSPGGSRAGGEGPGLHPTGETGGASAELRCLGQFRLAVDGDEVDVFSLRPQLREGLLLLAVHAGGLLHRERIGEALWPDSPPDRAIHNVHTLISTLRHALDDQLAGGAAIPRRGEAYRLALPEGARVDLQRFRKLYRQGVGSRRAGDREAEETTLRRVLRCYRGPLLPEVGAADWVVDEREHYRQRALTACRRLASLLLEREALQRAVQVCERGLGIDRYHDPLWRALLDAHRRAGHPGRAQRTAERYARALEELGVDAAVEDIEELASTR